MVAQQKQQFDLGKNVNLNHQYYANSSFGPMTYQGNLIPNTVPSFRAEGPMPQDDRISNSNPCCKIKWEDLQGYDILKM